MEFHHHPSKPDPGGNVAKMLTEILRGLDAPGKARFVATLDLQEPVAVLRRYAERGQLDNLPLLVVLLRQRDPELTAAVLAAPQLNEKKIYYPSNDDLGPDSVGRMLIREAMHMVDPDLLQAVVDALDPSDATVQSEFFDIQRTSWFGSALYALASQADMADFKKVEACARWASRARDISISQSEKSAGLKIEPQKRAAEQDNRDLEFANMLLILATKNASNHLTHAALAMGAQPNITAVSEAFQSGNPALSLKLLELLPKDFSSEDRLVLCKKMIQSIHSISQQLVNEKSERKHDPSKTTLYFESEFKKVSKDTGQAIEWALGEPASGNSMLGSMQRDLLGAALLLLEYFEDPELWMDRQIQKYPDPTPSEIAGLARARKWKKLDTRLAQAERAGVPSSWSQWVESSIARAAIDTVKDGLRVKAALKVKFKGGDKVFPGNELDRQWFFILAKRLSVHALFKKSKRGPMKALIEFGAYKIDEVLQAEARLEARALAKATPPVSSPPRTPSLRM